MREVVSSKREVEFVDMFGRSLVEGDMFAYPLGAGRSQTMAVFQLVSAEVFEITATYSGGLYEDQTYVRTEYKIKALKVTSVWRKNCTDRVSILWNGMNALRIPKEDVEEWLNQQAA